MNNLMFHWLTPGCIGLPPPGAPPPACPWSWAILRARIAANSSSPIFLSGFLSGFSRVRLCHETKVKILTCVFFSSSQPENSIFYFCAVQRRPQRRRKSLRDLRGREIWISATQSLGQVLKQYSNLRCTISLWINSFKRNTDFDLFWKANKSCHKWLKTQYVSVTP